jgi:abscisic-aldehyde oxidase
MVGVNLSAREYYIPGPSGSYLNYGAAASEVPCFTLKFGLR